MASKKTPQKYLVTVIDGSTQKSVIKDAVQAYLDNGLKNLFPKKLPSHYSSIDLKTLREIFESRIDASKSEISDIVHEVNLRHSDLKSPRYKELLLKDTSLWNKDGKYSLHFGVIACVDKGIPIEAVMGVEGFIGRTLGGDLPIYHSQTNNKFILEPEPIKKTIIHTGREDYKPLLELQIEHTGCGRRKQIIGNEGADRDVPSIGFIFKNILNLTTIYPNNSTTTVALEKIREYWENLPKNGPSVLAPDSGVYAGIIVKLAQRQAFQSSEINSSTKVVSPIGIYDKHNGNYYCGVDQLDVLTNERVISSGGFTDKILEELATKNEIFSLALYSKKIFSLLSKESSLSEGQFTYSDLQNNWLGVQEQLITLVEVLWSLLNNKNKTLDEFASDFISHQIATLPEAKSPEFKSRLTHQLFHMTAYAYLLGTLSKGNVPGHHIEDHLATGDHDIGTKTHLALGQGDMAVANSTEMFTGYSVLLHSKPGETGKPVITMIKLDTERKGNKPMTTEETRIARNDFTTFLKLWPYFLVGDIIPVLAIRGKNLDGSVSRLGMSVIASFGDLGDLFDSSSVNIPTFVPAATHAGLVIQVPAIEILTCGLEAGKDLKKFRHLVQECAQKYANPSVQEAVTLSLKK